MTSFYSENLLDQIDLSNKNISGILDLKNYNFINLKIVLCNNNNIKKLKNIPEQLTKLNCSNNKLTNIDNLPRNITELDISNNLIKKITIHNNLIFNISNNPITHITFDDYYDKDISFISNITTLKYLEFGKNFNQELNNLPSSLTHIIFGEKYNLPIENLPEHIEYIKIYNNEYYKRDYNNIANSITSLNLNEDMILDSDNYSLRIFLQQSSLRNLLEQITHIVMEPHYYGDFDILNSITYLKLNENYNKPFEYFSPNLEYLILGDSYNQELKKLPNSLIHLQLGNAFNKKIKFPKSLKTLITNLNYNQPLLNLPNTLIHLSVQNINQLGCKLPNSITNLTYKNTVYLKPSNNNTNIINYIKEIIINEFHKIIYIPEYITHLTFEHISNDNLYENSHNNSLNNAFEKLKSLTHMTFNCSYDKQIFFPENLEYLCFKYPYTKPLTNLPQTLTYIKTYDYNFDLNNLPDTITYLFMYHREYVKQEHQKNIVEEITELTLASEQYKNINILPKYLERLIIMQNIYIDMSRKKDIFPNTLKYFESHNNFDDILNYLPNSVEHLVLNNFYNKPIKKFPTNLKNLVLGEYFNQELNNLPSSLTHLTIKKYCSQSLNKLPNSLVELILENDKIIKTLNNEDMNITNYIHTITLRDNKKLRFHPQNLKKLILDDYYKEELINLPNTLEYLHIGRNYNKPLNLPNSLVELVFAQDSEFNQSLNNLPDTLKYLRLGEKFNKKLKTNLPNLTHLILYCNKLPSEFPQYVKILEIMNENIKKITNLPDTIENIISKQIINKLIDDKYKSIVTILDENNNIEDSKKPVKRIIKKKTSNKFY